MIGEIPAPFLKNNSKVGPNQNNSESVIVEPPFNGRTLPQPVEKSVSSL